MSSRNNVDTSLWNLYCFAGTWGYTSKPTTRKMAKRLISRSFSYEFGNLLNYFWGNDLSFFSLLIKLLGQFNLSILRIFSHFKWQFFVNTKNVVIFSVILGGENETSEFSMGGGFSSSILFLVDVKYRAKINLKTAKMG